MNHPQAASTIYMVAPTSFGFDEQTAATNSFQRRPKLLSSEITSKARAEFDQFVAKLRQHDIEVIVFEDQPLPPKPNAVFPNNWFTTWPDGRVFLYPMATPSRRVERSTEAIGAIGVSYKISDVIDLSKSEGGNKFLEGTGALVFDHANKYVYGCLSPRCDKELFLAHAQALGYSPIVFHAYTSAGVPIYHTNVVMGVQSTTAVLCARAITDKTECRKVIDTLAQTGHALIDISQKQLERFCANVLEVQNSKGQNFLILSSTAYDAYTLKQQESLAQDKTPLPMEIPTIEAVGGGSARCMVAEIFLPRK